MYSREITKLILDLEAKGYTAELTQKWLTEHSYPTVHLNTIYNHRKGPTAQEIIDEMITQQQQDITIADQQGNRKLAMHYRNELLKVLVPIKTEILSKSLSVNQTEVKHVIELVDPDNPAQTYPQDEVQAARRANIIPP